MTILLALRIIYLNFDSVVFICIVKKLSYERKINKYFFAYIKYEFQLRKNLIIKICIYILYFTLTFNKVDGQ